jgi:hypothetical protein
MDVETFQKPERKRSVMSFPLSKKMKPTAAQLILENIRFELKICQEEK